jgi:hypothetical protein
MFNNANQTFADLLAATNGVGGGTQDKTASETNTGSASPFAKGFFAKVASGDAEALAELEAYGESRAADGLSGDEVAAEINQFEAAEIEAGGEGSGDAGTDDGEGAGEGGEGGADDEFEAEKTAAMIEASNQAVADVLANSELAAALGIDQEKIAEFIIAEEAGAAYFETSRRVNEMIEKIASTMIPSQEDVAAATEFLKTAGVDVSSVVAQAAEFEKQASATTTESTAEKVAREAAEREQLMFAAMATLRDAGFDIEKVAADAESKKKMSGKAKAALGIGAGVGAAALGLAAGNKALGGRFSTRAGMDSAKAGVRAGADMFKSTKGQGLKDRARAAGVMAKDKATRQAKGDKFYNGVFR